VCCCDAAICPFRGEDGSGRARPQFTAGSIGYLASDVCRYVQICADLCRGASCFVLLGGAGRDVKLCSCRKGWGAAGVNWIGERG